MLDKVMLNDLEEGKFLARLDGERRLNTSKRLTPLRGEDIPRHFTISLRYHGKLFLSIQ